MSSDRLTPSGRHRGDAPSSAELLLRSLRRPGHRLLTKSLGATAAALGLATAFATPPGGEAIELTAQARAVPRTAVAAEAAAPSRAQSYGVIGFRATAKEVRKPATVTRTREDREEKASRSIRRSGFPPELGLTQHGLLVLNAVRDEFPEIHSFGGYRPGDMDHGSGNAVDTMISSRSQGDAVAAFVMAHASELNVKYVIWRQRIWYPSGTWRAMEDRGSPTANHYDHVHVSVN